MTITNSDNETSFPGGGDGGAENQIPRKVAIFIAFCGVGYQGMQKNPGAKTIEGELEEALFHAGAVTESDRGKPKQYDFARSARTDKGVSAVGQVISGRFFIDPPGFVDRLNSNLPDQIRVFGYKRVTTSFSSKKLCDRRRYVYLLPVFALDPISHRDREAVMASLGSGEEYVKCFECSERGRKNKIPCVVGNAKVSSFPSKPSGFQSDITSNTFSALRNEKIKSEALGSVAKILEDCSKLNTNWSKESAVKINENGKSLDFQSDNSSNTLNALRTEVKSEALGSVDVEVAKIVEECCKLNTNGSKESVEKIDGNGTNVAKKSRYNYGEKEKERFNRVLSCYVGSYNFHNFTTRMKADDPAANRRIISFTANTVVNLDGIEFIKCEVVGKSFMLHQIRKMMGLAVAIMRNCAPESLIKTAFSKDVDIVVPMAPEVGLYLDECFFTTYNTKLEDNLEEVSMEAYKEEAEAFKSKHIYTHIGATERRYGNMALWLHSLNYRNYPDLNYSVD